jgi:hypothetical protein
VLIGAIIIVAGLLDVGMRRYRWTAGIKAWFRRKIATTSSVSDADD